MRAASSFPSWLLAKACESLQDDVLGQSEAQNKDMSLLPSSYRSLTSLADLSECLGTMVTQNRDFCPPRWAQRRHECARDVKGSLLQLGAGLVEVVDYRT